MAQKRYFNWLDDDSTFAINQRDLTIMSSGRYCGFDGVLGADLDLVLNHETTGKIVVKQDLTNTPKLGCWRTKQGGIILEDAAITIAISAGDDTDPRIDLIVGIHEYVEAEGGATATYAVITGTAAAIPVAPPLTDVNKQVIIGTLYVPANIDSLDDAGVVYTPARKPDWYELHNLLDHVDASVIGTISNGSVVYRVAGKWVNTDFKTLTENTQLNMVKVFKDSASHIVTYADYPIYDSFSEADRIYWNFTHNHLIIGNNDGEAVTILPTIKGITSLGANLGGIFRLTSSGVYMRFELNRDIDDMEIVGALPIKLHCSTVSDTDPVQQYWDISPQVTAYFIKTATHWEIFDPAQIEKELRARVKKGGLDNVSGYDITTISTTLTRVGATGTAATQLLHFKDESKVVHIMVGLLEWISPTDSGENAVIATLGTGFRPRPLAFFQDGLTFVCPVWNLDTPYTDPKFVQVSILFSGEIILRGTENTLKQMDRIDLRGIKFFA